jgi:DNA-binding response OmpR family regulator
VNTVLRRVGSTKPITARVFPEIGLTIDYDSHDVTLDGKDIELTANLLSWGCWRKSARMVRYEEIGAQIWGSINLKIRNRIKYLIYLLRQKLEKDPENPQLILNREGLGYQAQH